MPRSPRRRGRTARLVVAYATNAPQLPGESVRDALARRLAETADKEVWNGTTLIGPHRDDLVFEMGGRPLASFASRGQQRTAILAFKLAEVDLLTALDGRPPLLLLDDVFSELDPDRRSHLVRRIAALPQAFVTTTTLDDLDPGCARSARRGRSRPMATGRRGSPVVARHEPPRPVAATRRHRAAARGRTGSATCCPRPPASSVSRTSCGWPGPSPPGTPWSPSASRRPSGPAGSSRVEPDAIVVAADEPIVAAELRLRALELLEAFAAAPGGARVRFLRLTGEAGTERRGGRSPRV